MANAPQVTFQSRSAPYPVLTSLLYAQSVLGGNNLPIPGSEISNLLYFRVYNNYSNALLIATMQNVGITVYDGAGAGSHTNTKSVTTQSWIRVYETGFGENSTPPGNYVQYLGDDTAIGKAGIDIYNPEKGSDGGNTNYIRAGTDQNGVGFIEFASYAELPDVVGFQTYNFAVSVVYDWTA